ncbi:transcriptional adapter 1-like isoform X1 [Schistocerca piceifrons]|uniref:transcriptional adapter 1-like isoform X1 n=2 Tax=Schistocerca piceifrons TaxID=274613 RepID=UPI001F5E6193|nr:transcriptional adapter 1-like isoform X1 [Schistocerca piceifrons]
MTQHDEVSRSRKRLFDALGSNASKYLVLLRLWFQMKKSKEEFDQSARKLLTSDQVHLHNAFIITLITKCHRLSPHPPSIYENSGRGRGGKGRRRNRAERGGFEPVDVFDYMLPMQQIPSHAQQDAVRLLAQERFLPDFPFMYSRTMLGAWEHGLEGAEDGAVKLIMSAVLALLRNIIFATICRRKSFHVLDSRSPYGVNKPYINKWLRRKLDKPLRCSVLRGKPDEKGASCSRLRFLGPTYEEMEQRYIFELACSSRQPPPNRPISLYDLLETVQVHRNVIPSASVMSLLEERIFDRLIHRTHEEMRAKRVLDNSMFLSTDHHNSTFKSNNEM